MRFLRHFVFIGPFCWLLAYGSASADDFLMSAASHALMEDFTGDPGAGLDLVLSAEWIPIPEFTLGLESAIHNTVLLGNRDMPATWSLRTNPYARFRFGREQSWAYIKLGVGINTYLNSKSTVSYGVLIGSMGYIVEPSELNMFFGFELTCEIDAIDSFSSQKLGLGGLIGFSF